MKEKIDRCASFIMAQIESKEIDLALAKMEILNQPLMIVAPKLADKMSNLFNDWLSLEKIDEEAIDYDFIENVMEVVFN